MKVLLCACVAALVSDLAPPACAEQVPLSPASENRSNAREPAAGLLRDPFVRPTAAADGVPAQPESPPAPPVEGLAGLSRDDISVRGLLQTDGRHVALVQGPDRKHYVIRPGDRLRDGVVQAVVPGGLVMVSDEPGPVDDRASRQLRKSPRPHGEGQ